MISYFFVIKIKMGKRGKIDIREDFVIQNIYFIILPNPLRQLNSIISYALFPYLIASFPIFSPLFRSFRIFSLKILFLLSRHALSNKEY